MVSPRQRYYLRHLTSAFMVLFLEYVMNSSQHNEKPSVFETHCNALVQFSKRIMAFLLLLSETEPSSFGAYIIGVFPEDHNDLDKICKGPEIGFITAKWNIFAAHTAWGAQWHGLIKPSDGLIKEL